MKYTRSNYYKSEMVDSLMEKDLINSSFSEYKFKDDFIKYRITYNEYMRPDITSFKIFGTTEYWWIILKCNPEIEDIWNDVAVDDEQEEKYPYSIKINEYINIPSKRDIDDFYSFSRNYLK